MQHVTIDADDRVTGDTSSRCRTMRYAFLVTSALNTRFGTFTQRQRLEQTVATVASIRSRVPDANVVLLEMSGEKPGEDCDRILKSAVDLHLDFTNDGDVRHIYGCTENWDVVKNATEMLCFRRALEVLHERKLLEGATRVFKLSGRYAITGAFDIGFYERSEVADKIVFKRRLPSQFSIVLTQVPMQYMSRLWSFPANMVAEMCATYRAMLAFMLSRVNEGGYVDIEHCLFKFIDPGKIVEVDQVGVTGSLGQTGAIVAE